MEYFGEISRFLTGEVIQCNRATHASPLGGLTGVPPDCSITSHEWVGAV